MLAEFAERFVAPMLAGGDVCVGRPIRPREVEMMLPEVGEVSSGPLAFARLRRAELLSPVVGLGQPEPDEVSLWAGLHNTLCFDHPERSRVWARTTAWRRVEGASRSMLTLPMPRELADGIARHVSVEAFLDLRRTDTVISTSAGDVRYLGQGIPRRRFGFGLPPNAGREETVPWLSQSHAPETHRLLEDAMRASPLTCLLRPREAPPGWSPLAAASFLQARGFARAICHRWAMQKDWVAVGGAVMAALLPSLPSAPSEPSEQRSGPLALPGAVLPSSPADIAAVVGALIHLHFLKVLEFDARLGVAVGGRGTGLLAFLSLPLLPSIITDVVGSPLGGTVISSRGSGNPTEGFEAQAHRRWTEYIDHLRELVPRATVENVLASLQPAIVGTT